LLTVLRARVVVVADVVITGARVEVVVDAVEVVTVTGAVEVVTGVGATMVVDVATMTVRGVVDVVDRGMVVEVDCRRDRTVVAVDVVVTDGTTVLVVVVVVVVAGGVVVAVVVGASVVVVDVVPDSGEPPEGDGAGTLFVTFVAAKVVASFPAESCTAFASFPAVGSVYATVTA
jgi:hypothetical protein